MTLYATDGGWAAGPGGGSGDVVGPASAGDDNIATFDGTTGKLIQDSGVDISVLTGLASTYQPLNAILTDLAGLTQATDRLPYMDSATTMALATFTGFARTLLDDADAATARTTLGLGTGDSPQFTGVNVGHASDTTLTRASAGNLAVEGNALYRAAGTDVPVTDGGTGASDASTARSNLGIGAANAPEIGGIELGHASDTTIARVSAGQVSIEGNVIYRAGGTDVPVTDGGTGSSTASGARTNLDVPSNAEAVLDTIYDAKGDLISASAADTPAKLTVGADDTVPTAKAAASVGIAWQKPSRPQSRGQAGMLTPAIPHAYYVQAALVGTVAYYGRFVADRDFTVTSMKFVVEVAAGTDDACDVGILDSTGARLKNVGATTGKLNSTGIKTMTLTSTLALTAGEVYYTAFTVPALGGSAAQLAMAYIPSAVGLLGDIFGTGFGTREIGYGIAHPVPSSASFSGATTTTPIFALV